ncbi:hypothetical protein PHYPSEUDO_000459 [Phytophthora pseudosyringae]|uniref:Uncharacterized protein n=1 Tax=Phytophthora pseudosyringae TaxID=221518 RepID=A0A8T1V3H8_9STRA|nr:hypothetical protein PHYPSEUDO_000459 [Phytophthora pseudosyringae]
MEESLSQLEAQRTTETEQGKRSRIIQCKNVLLAEVTAFLSFDSNFSKDDRGVRSEINPEDNSAAFHLFELKKHLSKELAQYVDVMVTEFDELAEGQSILAAKVTESTQLYMSFKRQCGVLEGQSVELTSGLETLHARLQKNDVVCKKLYQINGALLKRLQTPAIEAYTGPSESNFSSPRMERPPALAIALRAGTRSEMINPQHGTYKRRI